MHQTDSEVNVLTLRVSCWTGPFFSKLQFAVILSQLRAITMKVAVADEHLATDMWRTAELSNWFRQQIAVTTWAKDNSF